MERPPRHTSILIGLGLVLVGLLSGILVMLFVVDLRPSPVLSSQRVAPVELGRTEPWRAPATELPEGAPMDLTALNSAFRQVAQQVTPAVVYIQVDNPLTRDLPRDWFHNFEDEELQDRFLREMPRQSVGSGVIISPQGYVVTNHHVVDRSDGIQVTLSDKRQYRAEVVGIDPSTDLAVLRLDADADDVLPVAALGNSDALQVGEWVLAVGNPFRLTSTVTAGIVSALGRQVNIIEDRFSIEDFIQTDAAINPGNSGGALVNLQGELVGISTAIATESGSYEGYGFAVPVNLMERVVRDLIEFGEVQRGYLGVSIEDIDAARARNLGLDGVRGVYLNEVTRGGAAFRANLRRGDVVLTINGRSVDAPNELQSAIARSHPGDLLDVEYWRRGKLLETQVRLLGKDDPAYRSWFAEAEPEPQRTPERPPRVPEAEVTEIEPWGLGLRELVGRERNGFDLETGGVYVAYVERGTVADAAGLPRDVVLLRVGDAAVASVEEAANLLDAAAATTAETILLRVKRRDGLLAFYEIETPE